MKRVLALGIAALTIGCGDPSIKGERIPGRVRLTSLEESNPPVFLTSAVVDAWVSYGVTTGTVDYDCVSSPECVENMRALKERSPNFVLRVYINPLECFSDTTILDTRPRQKVLCTAIQTQYPLWRLLTVAGNQVSWWPGMYMLNLTSAAPRYMVNGEAINLAQYIVRHLVTSLADYRDVIDGVELDNVWPYHSWLIDYAEISIDANRDGSVDERWAIDGWLRTGMRAMIAGIRSTFSGFVVTCRGHQYVYLADCDGMTYEGPMGNDAIPGGAFGMVDRWIHLSAMTPYTTLNESASNDEAARDLYALTLMGDGYLAIDAVNEHGHFDQFLFTTFSIDIGDPVGPAEYPYTLEHAIEGMVTVTPSAPLTITAPRSGTWLIAADYELVGGELGASALEVRLPSETKRNDRWQDGELYYQFSSTNATTISFTHVGPGHSRLRRVRLFDVGTGKGYFYRPYAYGAVYYNATTVSRAVTLHDGRSVILTACEEKRCGGAIDVYPITPPLE